MENKVIKIGSEVMWRGGFGAAPARKAKVTGIEKCSRQRDKYGDPVDAIAWEDKNYGVFVLNNDRWCYGEQIVELI